jgi:Caspase domain
MTRVYRSPDKPKGLRVLIVGTGAYPSAKVTQPGVPVLADLTSVAPSVLAFAQRLLMDWRASLAMDLLSVDLLLSDPNQPGGAIWPGFGVPGEVPPNAAIDPPTLNNVDQALQDALAGAEPDEGLLLFFCGHGFSRADRFFVLSDFGRGGDPWSRTVNLSKLELGLQQEKPRKLWLFWDCCADIPAEILDALGNVGASLIQPRASALSAANTAYGMLSRFGAASSPLGAQAFGIAGKPTRFTEMLLEALEGAGATKRQGGDWWVDHVGIQDALQTFVKRYPDLPDPQFYIFVTPFSSDSTERMRFRRLSGPPSSFLLASSAPRRAALKQARLCVLPEGVQDDAQAVPGCEPSQPQTAVVRFKLPAWKTYTVKATFANGPQLKTCFADLPLAEPAEFEAP